MTLAKATLRIVAMGATALGLAATSTAAQDLRFTFGQPESYATYQATKNFMDKLAEAGMPGKLFTSGSLLTLGETTPGVRDGLADAGFVVLPYTPAEFSESILIANLSLLATTGYPLEVPGAGMNGATMEYIMLHCPECQVQMKAQNHVFTSGTSSQDYVLACTSPIRSLADFQGKRIRVGAANFTRWTEFLGGVPVQMPGNETYDGLSKNLLDCTTIGLADFYGQKHIEVTNSVIIGAPGGVYASLGFANFNRDTWQGLSEEQRVAAMNAAAYASAESIMAYSEFDKIGYDATVEGGKHEIIQAADDIVAKTLEFAEADLVTIEAEMTEKYGVQNAAEKLAKSRELIEKWKVLTKDIKRGDTEALAQLYMDEIYSKLGLASYGMD